MATDDLSRIMAQTVLDVQRLQAEDTSGATTTITFVQLIDEGRFTDTISGTRILVMDSAVANLSRCNPDMILTNQQDFVMSEHVGTTESPAGTITLSATPSTGSFLGVWETYCGSWRNFYWSGTTPASTSIEARIYDSSGGALLASGTSSPLDISSISAFRPIRPVFILSSSLGGNNPTLGEYRITYDGVRANDQGVYVI